MIDLSETAENIARRLITDLRSGKLASCGIDEVRDAIADETFPEELGRVRAEQLEVLTLRKFFSKIM